MASYAERCSCLHAEREAFDRIAVSIHALRHYWVMGVRKQFRLDDLKERIHVFDHVVQEAKRVEKATLLMEGSCLQLKSS